ncbi:MAG TPA: hypothetical protein VK982_05950 [Bacteroidales bacterium]|nr:hypothetical protein [Bacteroidales bacterium]
MRDAKLEKQFFELLEVLVAPHASKRQKEIKLQIFIYEARKTTDVFQEFQEELEGLI